ncbi:sulfurtransferase [Acinetobacter sp. 1207_04]|uniref:sulfurtransferase n=1 Tax=Acinetobacter sp. 1207_04 TaxID=2604449 RepID=UPI0040589C74
MTAPLFNFGLLVNADQLLPHLGHTFLRIVDLSRSSVFEQLHIPHAIHVKPGQLVQLEETATGLLPEEADLQALVDYLKISPDHHVVVYDDEGGAWAGRLIWNLHCLGFDRVSLLNGGIHAWLGADYPTSSDIEEFDSPSTSVKVDLSQVENFRIQYDDLRQKVEQQAIQLWDCRTEDEYAGLRMTARRGGHIPGARHFEWSTAIARQNHLKLHSLERTQQRLEQLGFDLSQPVVVYCQSHHRSGLAYIVGKLLNWDIVAYDGAWSEWGNRSDSPIITGESPA